MARFKPYTARWNGTPVYVLGTCRRRDEGEVGHDLRVRPVRLGKGTYTMVVAPDDVTPDEHHSTMAKPETLKLKDRYSGGDVWLTMSDGKVVGAMGSDPQRYVGLTLAQAQHHARHGGTPLHMTVKSPAQLQREIAEVLAGHAHSTIRRTSGRDDKIYRTLLSDPEKRWCLAWRSPAMSAPAFWYFATKREASAALAKMLGHGPQRKRG